ncbi:MAG: hypothetical protein K2L31_02700, partial [Muribaculum sp.]|nr:hypothetical protein [Muribaculum sp.]
TNIGQLERHMTGLVDEIKPRQMFQRFCNDFHRYVAEDDYSSVLRVYNQKSMLPASNVAGLCGLANKDAYIKKVIDILRHDGPGAERIRKAIISCFGIDETQASAKPTISLAPND